MVSKKSPHLAEKTYPWCGRLPVRHLSISRSFYELKTVFRNSWGGDSVKSNGLEHNRRRRKHAPFLSDSGSVAYSTCINISSICILSNNAQRSPIPVHQQPNDCRNQTERQQGQDDADYPQLQCLVCGAEFIRQPAGTQLEEQFDHWLYDHSFSVCSIIAFAFGCRQQALVASGRRYGQNIFKSVKHWTKFNVNPKALALHDGKCPG